MRQFILIITLAVFFPIRSFSQTIDSIEILGTKKMNKNFILKLLDTKPDQILDSLIVEKDVNGLKKLPGISHVTYTVNPTSNNYSIQFLIEENETIIPVVNFWTSTNRTIAYKLGIYDYNLFGKNITIGGFYQNNGYDTYALNFRAPQLISSKIGVSIHHQNWKSEEPLYFKNGTANYLYNNVSVELSAIFQLNTKNNFEIGVSKFKEQYDYIDGITDSSIPTNLNINKDLYKIVYNYENLTYFYQYIDGFKSQFYGQLVNSNDPSQANFLIAWNDLFLFKRIGNKGNWANRIRLGLSSNNDSPFAPFSVDNNVNLRGVGIIIDRGTGSIVLNSEYRYTLFDKKWFSLQGNAFVDAGTWRNPGGELSDFIDHKNVRVFSGIGLRFIHKKIFNATFRIDYGHSLKKDGSKGLVFGIGQYF